MTEALYERYKEALRRGHVASTRGHHAAAIEAYAEAARIAPDRALPLVGLGTVLARLGKPAEALAAFDGALDRAPTDEAALRGRADLLLARGDRSGAADALDRLSQALDAAGRLADATDAARRALELAESRSRRRSVTALSDRLRAIDGDPTVAEALTRALSVLEGRALESAGGLVPREADAGSARAGDAAATEEPTDAPSATEEPTDAPAAAESAEPEPVEPEPAEPAPVAPAPFDAAAATAEVETAAESGDVEATVTSALAAAIGHRAAGSVGAALDACYLALGVRPTEPRLHLMLSELYLDRGWRSLAVEKLVLLRRLAELTDDAATLEGVAAIAAARLADEPRLVTASS